MRRATFINIKLYIEGTRVLDTYTHTPPLVLDERSHLVIEKPVCVSSYSTLDFSEAFDKVDHGIHLHKLRAVGITGNIGIWLFHFLTDRSHFVQLSGCISEDHHVLSGVPQGTVFGLLLFLIMISDIAKDVSASKLVSFADEPRLYSGVGDVTDCDNLQFDLNAVYDWASSNNMFFNSQKFCMFVLAPTYLPISQICILALR